MYNMHYICRYIFIIVYHYPYIIYVNEAMQSWTSKHTYNNVRDIHGVYHHWSNISISNWFDLPSSFSGICIIMYICLDSEGMYACHAMQHNAIQGNAMQYMYGRMYKILFYCAYIYIYTYTYIHIHIYI